MQLKISTGLCASLLAGGLAVLVSGCDTPPPGVPPNRTQPPKVVALYAVDNIGGNVSSNDPRSGVGGNPLPDVLIFSADADHPGDSTKVSPAPLSYGSFRVEFDQPMDGTTLGANNDLNLSASYCTPPKAGASIHLIDTAGGTATELPASVCYDPTSNLGQHPHVILTMGSGTGVVTGGGTIPNPFTCQDFNADYGFGPGGSTLQGQHAYAIKVDTSVKSSTGNALTAAVSVPFQSSGFDIMAAGYQDQNTGYYHWLKKPYLGFMKDLAEEGAAFTMPHDGTSFIVLTTYGAFESPLGNGPAGGDAGSAFIEITAVRTADQSSIAAAAGPLNLGEDIYTYALTTDPTMAFVYDPRISAVAPGDTWEPGVSYTVTVSGNFSGAGPADSMGNFTKGTPVASAQTYTFSAAAGSLSLLSSTPANGATSVLPLSGNAGGSFSAQTIVFEFQAPVDANGCPDGQPCVNSTNINATNFVIKDGTGTAIPGSFSTGNQFNDALTGAALNNQQVEFTPTTFLPLSQTITATVQNVKAATLPSLGALSGTTFPSATVVFSTGNFRIGQLRSTTFPGILSRSIDRSTIVPPQDLPSMKVYVQFTQAADPTTLTTANVALTEVNTDGTTAVVDPAKYSIIPRGGGPEDGSRYYVQITDPTYALKFGQGYRVTTSTAIKSGSSSGPGAGVALKAEGCTSGDCSDAHTFTTLKFGPGCPQGTGGAVAFGGTPITYFGAKAGCRAISKSRDSSGKINGVVLLFNEPVDAASFPSPASAFVTMTGVSADGKTTTPVTDLTCTPSQQNPVTAASSADFDTLTCTSPSILPNTTYTATALFKSDKPVKVTASLNGQPTDPKSGTFFGSTTRTFTTGCP